MFKRTRFLALVAVATGGLLGDGAATGRLGWIAGALAAPQDREAVIPFEVLVPAGAALGSAATRARRRAPSRIIW
jgi:hypothetical protein